MKLISVTFVGYRILQLNGYNTFEYTPEADLQLILGSNGSGKSALMSELSPLPPSTGLYDKDGSKTMVYYHNGSTYKLVSTFKSGAKHQFYKDDLTLNLNPGGTGQVQKELVRQEFGYTSALHDLLTGRIRFTEMLPATRRQWITHYNPADLDYALRVYREVEKANRENNATLKHINNRIATENTKLSSIQDLETIEEKVGNLKRELMFLMREKSSNVPSYSEKKTQLNEMLQRLETVAKIVLTSNLTPPSIVTITNHDNPVIDIENVISDIRHQQSLKEGLLVHYAGEYSEMDQLLSKMDVSRLAGTDELNNRLEELEEEYSRTLISIEEFNIDQDPEPLLDDTIAVSHLLVDLFSRLPANPTREFNRDRLQEITEQRDELVYAVNRRLNLVNQIESRLEGIRSAKSSTCPKCAHTWVEGVSDNEVHDCQGLITKHRELINADNQTIESLNEKIAEMSSYSEQLKQYRNIIHNYPRLKVLWDHIRNTELVFESPSNIVELLYVWERDLKRHRLMFNVRREMTSINEAIEHTQRINQSGGGHFQDRIVGLKAQISQMTDELETLKANMSELNNYKQRVVRFQEAKMELQKLHGHILEIHKDIQEALRDDMINKVIDKHQVDLAMMQSTLNEKTTLETIIRDLNESRVQLENDRVRLQRLIDAMSPSSGLIAKQLSNVILSVVENINRVVKAVWVNPFVIQPCGIEDGELDYLFPFKNNGLLVPDIRDGSRSQTDIIDFAFVLMGYHALGLQDYPLFLDELGSSFDEAHRTALMNFIRVLLANKQFSQVFMISHYMSEHGSFENADVIVTDSANIIVPDNANRCVTIS